MAEKSKTIVVKTPKGMTKIEWESIRGSNLHAQMIKNRSVMIIDTESAAKKMQKIVQEWLETNCGTQYYFDDRRDLTTNWKNTIVAYIEGDTDAVNFCLNFKDHDYPEEDPPPVKASAPPYTVGGLGITPKSAPSVEKELMDMIMQELIKQDQVRYLRAEKDRWTDMKVTSLNDPYLYKTDYLDMMSQSPKAKPKDDDQ